MTPEDYREALTRLGETQTGFAEWLGCHAMTGKSWARKGPPPAVAKLVRYLTAKQLKPWQVDYAITGERRPRLPTYASKRRAA